MDTSNPTTGSEQATPMDTNAGAPTVIDISGDGGVVKRILREGSGAETPAKGSKVFVHYVGRLTDGTEFDSSRKRNEEFTFELGAGRVIKGWDAGVATMKRGELAELTCKPEYAYGKAGSPPTIPKNATLVFEVELIRWQDGEDLSEDGGVVKRLVSEGSGWKKPKAGEVAQVRVRGLLEDGTEFLSGESPVWITIGDTKALPDAVSKAVSNMKKGEKARVTSTAQYAYGSSGSESLRVPPNANVTFEVELVSWVEVNDVGHDGGILRKTLKDGEGFKTPKDGSVVRVKIATLPRADVPLGEVLANKSPVAYQEVELELGSASGKVPEAVELALESMKLHERALVEVKPAHLKSDLPDAKESLAFDVVLESFSSVKDSWEMSGDEKLAEAASCKDKGSELFRAGKYSAADKKYNKGLKLVENEASLSEPQKAQSAPLCQAFYLNLAAVGLKLGKYPDVVKNCKKVLDSDSKNVKALFRRAQASHHLAEYEAAKADLLAAAELEPQDKAIKVELAAVNRKIQEQKAKEKKLYGNLFEKLSKMEQSESQKQQPQNGDSNSAKTEAAPMDTSN